MHKKKNSAFSINFRQQISSTFWQEMQEKCIFAKTHLENSDFVRTFADMPKYDIALELARLHILTGADFVRQLTGHNYVKKSGMSPVPRLIIIGVTEPLMRLKNCAQRN